MGAKRRKWRPAELAAELQLLDQPVDATEEDVARALERLARPSEGAVPEEQVVQLSTRYIRRDLFVVEDEVDFIDLLILKILDMAGSKGASATVISISADLLHFIPISRPTILNHLRALKSPGWEFVEKTGDALRDHYRITLKGSAILGEAEDATIGYHNYTGEWRDRVVRMGLVEPDGSYTKKASLLLEKDFIDIVLQGASESQTLFIESYMHQKLNPDEKRKRTSEIAALELIGFHKTEK